MIYIKQMFHTCPESEAVLRTIEWDRGKWKCGIKIVTKCPCCKEKLPLARELNQVGIVTQHWQMSMMPPIEYEAIVLSVKPIVKRKKRNAKKITDSKESTNSIFSGDGTY